MAKDFDSSIAEPIDVLEADAMISGSVNADSVDAPFDLTEDATSDHGEDFSEDATNNLTEDAQDYGEDLSEDDEIDLTDIDSEGFAEGFSEDTEGSLSSDEMMDAVGFSEDVDDDLIAEEIGDADDRFAEDTDAEADGSTNVPIESFTEDTDLDGTPDAAEDDLNEVNDPDPYDVPDDWEEITPETALPSEITTDIPPENPVETEQVEVIEDTPLCGNTSNSTAEINDRTDEMQPSSINDPIHTDHSDVDWYIANSEDIESLQRLRDGLTSGQIVVDTDDSAVSDMELGTEEGFAELTDKLPEADSGASIDSMGDQGVPNSSAYSQLQEYMNEHNYGRDNSAYSHDPTWQQLNNDFRVEQGLEPIDYGTQDWTDTHVDDVRDELVAMGIPEDSPELAAILQNEQQGIEAIRGTGVNVPETAEDTDDGTSGGGIFHGGDPIHMTQSDVDWYMENAGDSESLRQMRDGIASGRIAVDADTEIPTDAVIEEVTDVPTDIDYDAVFTGLDSYDFDGIDVSCDVERLDSSLENFQSGTWENLSADDQKAAMSDLADYVQDVIGFDNPPEIVYYSNPVDGDYGGYSPGTNTLSINEYMLYDNNEAADTVAHELWHAYQHERAMNPQSAKDFQYQYGFDNYIRPDDDFTAYQDQLVEAEARAFAQQFKDRLQTKGRSI